jgi:hypothetical protein
MMQASLSRPGPSQADTPTTQSTATRTDQTALIAVQPGSQTERAFRNREPVNRRRVREVPVGAGCRALLLPDRGRSDRGADLHLAVGLQPGLALGATLRFAPENRDARPWLGGLGLDDGE